MSNASEQELATRIRQRLTVVLVRGEMTLHDGTKVDSRQVSSDRWVASAVDRALLGTPEWWEAVASISLPTITAGESILVIGPRTVAKVAPNGETKRSALKTVLKGTMGKLFVRRSGMDDKLPAGYLAGAELKANGGLMGIIGTHEEPPSATWMLLDGPDYYLQLVASTLEARVVVDTTGAFLEGAYGTVGYGTLDVQVTRPPATTQQLVVMPDTPNIRRRLRSLERGVVGEARPSFEDPEEVRDHRDHLRFAVAHAECHVSGLFREGRWSDDPAHLEAARTFLQQRFDLKVGLWDLALNPALASAVLEPQSLPSAPTTRLVASEGEHQRAHRAADRSAAKKGAKQRAELQIVTALRRLLAPAGWRVADGRLSCALTKPVADWPGNPKFPLVVLHFSLNKTSAEVSAWQRFYNQLDITAFVNARRAAFEEVAELPGKGDRQDRATVSLWRGSGGWADPQANWETVADELVACTRQWKALFADLVASCEAVRNERFQQARGLGSGSPPDGSSE